MFTGPKQVTTLSHACLARRAPAPTPWPCAVLHAPSCSFPTLQLVLRSVHGRLCNAGASGIHCDCPLRALWPVLTLPAPYATPRRHSAQQGPYPSCGICPPPPPPLSPLSAHFLSVSCRLPARPSVGGNPCTLPLCSTLLAARLPLTWDRGFAGGGTGFGLGVDARGGGAAAAVAVAVLVAAFSLQPGWIVSVWTLALVPVGGAGARLWCSVLSL